MARCVECGSLAVRAAGGALAEVDADMRLTGRSPKKQVDAGFPIHLPIYEPSPHCFALAFALPEEMQGENPGAFLAVIGADRECKRFIAWQRGFSPKEHAQMILQEKLLDWQKEEGERNRRFQFRMTVLYVVGTLLSGIAVAGLTYWLR